MLIKLYTDILSIICINVFLSKAIKNMPTEFYNESSTEQYSDIVAHCTDPHTVTIAECAWNVLAEYFNDISSMVKIELIRNCRVLYREENNETTGELVIYVIVEPAEIAKIQTAIEDDTSFFNWVKCNYYPSAASSFSLSQIKAVYFNSLFSNEGRKISLALSSYLAYLHKTNKMKTTKCNQNYYQEKLEKSIRNHYMAGNVDYEVLGLYEVSEEDMI